MKHDRQRPFVSTASTFRSLATRGISESYGVIFAASPGEDAETVCSILTWSRKAFQRRSCPLLLLVFFFGSRTGEGDGYAVATVGWGHAQELEAEGDFEIPTDVRCLRGDLNVAPFDAVE